MAATTPAEHPSPRPQSAAPRGRAPAFEWTALAILSAILVGSRSFNFDAPLDPDEANYGFIGARLLAGDRMYVDVWDQQPPLTFMVFGVLRAMLGPAEGVFRGFAAACAAATLLLMYFGLRRGLGVWPALSTALLWALVSHDPSTDGDHANREVYMNLCALGAFWCLARALTTSRTWIWFVAAGAALGIGSVLKLILALHWFAAAPFVLWSAARAGRTSEPGLGVAAQRWRGPAMLAALLAFAAAPAAIWLAHIGYFALDGRLKLFIDAVFLHNVGYAAGDVRGAAGGLTGFFTAEPWVFTSAAPLWWAGVIGFVIGPWRNPIALLGRVFAITALAEVILPGKFWRHYYLLLLPWMAVLAGMGVARIVGAAPATGAEHGGRHTPRRVAAGVALVCLCAPLLWAQWFWYYSRSSEERSFLRYVIMALWPRKIGLAADRHARPEDTLYMHGDAVGVYYYGNRRPLSKYTMASQFMLGEYAGAAARRAEVAASLAAQSPRYIFLMAPPYPELEARLDRDYLLICRHGPLLVFAHHSTPPAEIPPPEVWVWTPRDPEMPARCEALNARYKIWHPPPAGD